MPNGEERSLFLVIVQPEEFHEVLILRTQPAGFLQRAAMCEQIIPDGSVVGVQAASVDIECKAIEAPPIV